MQINDLLRTLATPAPKASPPAAAPVPAPPADTVQLTRCPYLASLQQPVTPPPPAPSQPLAKSARATAAKAAEKAAFGPSTALTAKLLGVEFQKLGRGWDFWNVSWKDTSPERAVELAVKHEPLQLRAPGAKEWMPVKSLEQLDVLLNQLERAGKVQATAQTGAATAQLAAGALSGVPVHSLLQPSAEVSPQVGLLEFLNGARHHMEAPVTFLQEFHAKHGQSFQVDIPTKGHFLFDTRPEVLHTALVNTDAGEKSWSKSKLQGHGAAFLIGEKNMFLSGGEDWKAISDGMRPLFAGNVLHTEETVSQLTDIFDDHLNDLQARVKANGGQLEIDTRAEMQAMVLDVAMQLFLSAKLPKEELRELQGAFKTQMEWLTAESVNPTNLSLSHVSPELSRAYEKLESVADRLLQERKASGNPGNDLLGAFLKIKDPATGEPLSDERIRHEMLSFMEAGHETTATMMGWSLLMLAQHPDKMAKLQHDVDGLGGARPGLKQLESLGYVENTVKESLRLYPTFYLFMREANEDLTVGDVQVPKGTTLVSSLYNVHRDERTWGVEKTGHPANEFHPERFEESTNGARMMPFGAGKRGCIGQALGRMEGELLLTRFAQKFEMVAAHTDEVRLGSDLSIHPQDGRVTIKVRDASAEQGFKLR